MVNRDKGALMRKIEEMIIDTQCISALLAEQEKNELGFACDEMRKAGKDLERALSWLDRA